MGVDPLPQPGEELLRWLGAEARVDLHREDGGCRDGAEQRKRQVTLPGCKFRLDDDRDTGGDLGFPS
jgi:hypothetical protein